MNYHMPTQIVFGSGTIARLTGIIKEKLKASRPFLVTDKGIAAAGILNRVKEPLAGVPVFDEIEPNPRHATVDRGGELVRALQPDLVIGLGGGSVLDAAKAMALLATNPGLIEDYEGREKYETAPLPVLAIPTTCGTGSEVTWVSVITHTGRRFKMSVKGPLMFPAVALVDPDLLVTLPSHLVASTGLDALTHAVEAYTSKPASPITDALALEASRLIFRYLPAAYKDIRNDAEAREGLMLGSLLAGMAFGNSDVGAVHCLAEAIGSLYDTPHGVANAVFLPYVMEFNYPAAREKYAVIAAAVGFGAANQDEGAGALIRKIKALSHSLSISSFRDLRIPEGDFVAIAQKSFENNSNASNPRPVSADDYLAILKRAHKTNL
ncbi:MAG: iron-containing alcohol dehydrogenase [Clostridiales bacterium]|jgi:alcohol dehydrogenase|nr:iron-containing alcohol dehydrogenase [Clostridiales bacterium]